MFGLLGLLENACHALVRRPQVVIREVARHKSMDYAWPIQFTRGGTTPDLPGRLTPRFVELLGVASGSEGHRADLRAFQCT